MQPIGKYRAGAVSAAVFEREVQGRNGGTFKSQSVALQISYKNKDGEFVNNTLTIIKNNLPKVLDVLQQAQQTIGA